MVSFAGRKHTTTLSSRPLINYSMSRNLNLVGRISIVTGLVFTSFGATLVLAGTEEHTTAVVTAPQLSADPTLGPGDTVTLATPDIPELDKRVLSVDADGYADVPLIGRVQAGDLTPTQFAAEVTQRLLHLYLHPQVSISLVELKSRSVSVLGSVNTPGVQQADGRRKLLEVLSTAGGLRADAGPRIEVTRPISSPAFPPVLMSQTGGNYQTVSITAADLLEGKRPELNFVVQQGDVITVPKARLVYVVGDVKKSGGFVLGEADNITVLKALALAEGLDATADGAHARILRKDGMAGEGKPIDLKKLLTGKNADIELRADDVLFVPSSVPKKAAIRVLEAAIQTGTGLAIWR